MKHHKGFIYIQEDKWEQTINRGGQSGKDAAEGKRERGEKGRRRETSGGRKGVRGEWAGKADRGRESEG